MDSIVINVHSMVDLITNSSTELFVLDTKKSLGVVRDILQCAIDLHNKAHGTHLAFENIFAEPYIGSGEDALDGWTEHYSSKVSNGIIIRGAQDNSIPYWMFDFIEDVFGWETEQFHLG